MKNKKILLFLTMVLFMPFSVKAAATLYQSPVTFENGAKNVVKVYDTTSQPNHIARSRTMYLWIEENGNRIVAYCLDFGTPLGIPSSSGDDSKPVADTMTLEAFLKTKFDDAKVAKIIEQLNYYYYFGYKEGEQTRGKPEWFLATQAMMWQYLGDEGFYLNVTKGQVEDIYTEAEVENMLAGRAPTDDGVRTNVQPKNIRFVKYDSSLFSGNLNVLLPPIFDQLEVVNISTARNAINNSITEYKTLPAICDSRVREMKINDTLKLTDNKLSKYSVSCDNGTCEKSGNDLIITSGNEVGEINITLERQEGYDLDSMIYRVRDSENNLGQGVGVIGGKLPKMSCTLKVKVVKSACYICGTDYVWTDNPSDSCELQDEITDKDSCAKPEPEPEQCYVCTNGNHTWGTNNPDPDNCNPDPDIAKPNCVTTPQTSGLRIAYISLICGLAAAIAFVYFYSKKQTDK